MNKTVYALTAALITSMALNAAQSDILTGSAQAAVDDAKKYPKNMELSAARKTTIEAILDSAICPTADAQLGVDACDPSAQRWQATLNWDGTANAATASMAIWVPTTTTKRTP